MLTPRRLRYPSDARVEGMSVLEVLAMAVDDANASASKSATDAREARGVTMANQRDRSRLDGGTWRADGVAGPA